MTPSEARPSPPSWLWASCPRWCDRARQRPPRPAGDARPRPMLSVFAILATGDSCTGIVLGAALVAVAAAMAILERRRIERPRTPGRRGREPDGRGRSSSQR